MENYNNEKLNKDLDKTELLFSFVLIIALVFVSVFVLNKNTSEEVEVVIEEDNSEAVLNLFENLDLEAKAVFVWDSHNKEEIYSRNSESQLPLASLTKVMMALVATENAPEGLVVRINSDDLREEGDSGLLENERWTLKDIIDFSLVVSSNDGAMAIASAVGSQISEDDGVNEFIGLMNKKVDELGMTQTYFISPSGLDKDDIIPGGNGSIRDIVTLFDYVLNNNPSVLEATSHLYIDFSSLGGIHHEAENTNDLVNKLPGIVASKTGFTDLAGGNLVVAFEPEPGRPIIIAVMGSSVEGRFSDIEKLYLTTLDKFSL